MQHHRDDNQSDANAKREIQFLVFAENEHREDDAIDRFQIVGQIDGEGWNLLQDNDLQQAKPNGANYDHEGEIGVIHPDGIEPSDGDEHII